MRLVVAPVPGVVSKVVGRPDQQVVKGQILFELKVLEMKQQVPAPVTGTIRLLLVKNGEQVSQGALLAEIDL